MAERMILRLKESPTDKSRYTTYPEIGNLQLLHAVYKRLSFAPHFHEGHVIGVIENGCLGFDYKGEKVLAGKGDINIADPGEVHNGFSADTAGWQYRMFYLSPGQLDRICNELCGRRRPMPFFKKGVIRDRLFARQIQRLHQDFENPDITLLEKESRFHLLLSSFLLKYAKNRTVQIRPGSESAAVARVKQYILSCFNTNIGLEDLSRQAGFSKYYLLRVFAKETGLTPHGFLNQVRIENAKRMLKSGITIVDTALSTGFCDQSHMNRVFKKICGITPGQFKEALK